MTKQQEIKEGLVDKLRERYCWNPNYIEFHNGVVGEILSYLHSQGVVIKADRELPENPYIPYDYHRPYAYMDETEDDRIETAKWGAYRDAQQDMLKAGYVAVEPLVDIE